MLYTDVVGRASAQLMLLECSYNHIKYTTEQPIMAKSLDQVILQQLLFGRIKDLGGNSICFPSWRRASFSWAAGTWVSSGHSFNLRTRRTMSDNGRNLFFWLSRLPARRRRTEGKEGVGGGGGSIHLALLLLPIHLTLLQFNL